MPAMTITTPPCCSLPEDHWPFALRLPGAVLYSSRFDPALLTAADFRAAGIKAPATVQRSVAKRQAEYLAGRLCARAALQQLNAAGHLGLAACNAPGLGDDRAPVWPGGVTGAITHSNGWAAAIVAPTTTWRGLGLDSETLLPSARAERLAKEILNAGELQQMAALAPAQRAQRITLTFSIKESLFKALYPLVLKRFYFEHAEVLDWDERGHARLRLLTDLSCEFHHGVEFSGQFAIDEGRVLTLVYLP